MAEWFDEVQSGMNEDVSDAQKMLIEAGVDPEIVKSSVTPGIAALIVRAPTLVQVWAARYPKGAYSTYTSAESQFFGGRDAAVGLSGMEGPPSGTSTSTLGSTVARRDSDTGVIVTEDQTTGTINVLYPNDTDGTIPGSPMWRRKARKSWNNKEIKMWRKKLYDKGYISSADGGFNTELFQALGDFFTNKYADLPHPGSPTDQKSTIRDAYDPILMRQDARDTLANLFQDGDPSDAEVEELVKFAKRQTKQSLNKGASPQHAQAHAQEQMANKIMDDPATQKYLDLQEVDTSQHDSFVNLYQSIRDIAS